MNLTPTWCGCWYCKGCNSVYSMSASQYLRAADNMAAKISQRFLFVPSSNEPVSLLPLVAFATEHVVPLQCLSCQVPLSLFWYWYLHPDHQCHRRLQNKYPCVLLQCCNPNWSRFIVFLAELFCLQEFVPYWAAALFNEGFSCKWRDDGTDGSSSTLSRVAGVEAWLKWSSK